MYASSTFLTTPSTSTHFLSCELDSSSSVVGRIGGGMGKLPLRSSFDTSTIGENPPGSVMPSTSKPVPGTSWLRLGRLGRAGGAAGGLAFANREDHPKFCGVVKCGLKGIKTLLEKYRESPKFMSHTSRWRASWLPSKALPLLVSK